MAKETAAEDADELTRRGAWGDATDAGFQEYVAREHLDGRMPVVELHRNHGLPLGAVKRWIATFRAEGRAGLERDAALARARAATREATQRAKGATPEELAALRVAIATGGLAAKRAAYATIAKRHLDVMVPAIVDAMHAAAVDPQRSLQDELELLAALKAQDALHELVSSGSPIARRYAHWLPALLQRAGCAIETIERPWSQRYQLRGTWYPLPRP